MEEGKEETTNSVHVLSEGFDNDSLIFGIFCQDVSILQSFGGRQKEEIKRLKTDQGEEKKEGGIKRF